MKGDGNIMVRRGVEGALFIYRLLIAGSKLFSLVRVDENFLFFYKSKHLVRCSNNAVCLPFAGKVGSFMRG